MTQIAPIQISQALARIDSNTMVLYKAILGVRRRLAWSEMDRGLAAAGRTARLPLELRAQHGEDIDLWDLFTGKLEGVFIEVGAYDGQSLSVSWAFEAIGWTGLLIEALPDRVEACRAARPGSRVEHAALGKPGSPATTTFNAAEAGMLSFLSTDPRHLDRVRREGGSRQIAVPQTTMDALLERGPGVGIPVGTPIDFAVIDVEGGEPDLLAGFDLARHHVRVLVIEDNQPGERTPLTEAMASRPYVQVRHEAVNRFYVHREEKELVRRARWVFGR